MFARSLMIVGVGLVLCACEAMYVQPDASQPNAELNLRSGRTGAFDRNGFDGYTTELCEEKEGEGTIVEFLGPYRQTAVRIPAGARYYLAGSYAVVSNISTSTIEFTRCIALISFVPDPSGKYEAKQTSSVQDCPISLIDVATGKSVPTYQVHKPVELCRKK
jgi:hypothetical protein